jgi:hypothetical protein
MTTPTSYIARDITLVVNCVELLFQKREEDRQTFATKLLETCGAYDPSEDYEGVNIFKKLCPEDRCLVARHLREGDSTNRGFSDAARTPPVFKLHLAAVKAEWLRLQDDEEEPMCTYCGCDPNVEDHLHDCEALEYSKNEAKAEPEAEDYSCRCCGWDGGNHHHGCDYVKSDRM